MEAASGAQPNHNKTVQDVKEGAGGGTWNLLGDSFVAVCAVCAAGFKGGRMRWQDVQGRFTKLGLGKPIVALVREGSGSFIQVKGERGEVREGGVRKRERRV